MPAIEPKEALRFVAAGGVATLGNLATVTAARTMLPYSLALLLGIVSGMTLSLLLTKVFVFRVRQRARSGGETGRFLIVYGVGLLIYYFAAFQMRALFGQLRASPQIADAAGVLAGAGLMVVTGYFGHRFFTYRTNREGVV